MISKRLTRQLRWAYLEKETERTQLCKMRKYNHNTTEPHMICKYNQSINSSIRLTDTRNDNASLALEEYLQIQYQNTFNIPSIARYFLYVRNAAGHEELVCSSVFQRHRRLILGGWSSILLANEVYDSIALKNGITGIKAISQDETHATPKVGSGVV